LLRGEFVGKDTITVRSGEVDGEKKLTFESVGPAVQPELVGAGAGEEVKE
jgi:hypothetical protein